MKDRGCVLCQIPPLESKGLVSSLDRTSGTPRGVPALASSTDTSGTSDKRPVLIQHAGQGALCVDHECFTQAWTSCLEPGHSVVKEPVGKPSLSGEPECLSLHGSLLFVHTENG